MGRDELLQLRHMQRHPQLMARGPSPRAHLLILLCQGANCCSSIPTAWPREGRKLGSIEAKPGNCPFAISQPEAVNDPQGRAVKIL